MECAIWRTGTPMKVYCASRRLVPLAVAAVCLFIGCRGAATIQPVSQPHHKPWPGFGHGLPAVEAIGTCNGAGTPVPDAGRAGAGTNGQGFGRPYDSSSCRGPDVLERKRGEHGDRMRVARSGGAVSQLQIESARPDAHTQKCMSGALHFMAWRAQPHGGFAPSGTFRPGCDPRCAPQRAGRVLLPGGGTLPRFTGGECPVRSHE